jgi:hypothetical protein
LDDPEYLEDVRIQEEISERRRAEALRREAELAQDTEIETRKAEELARCEIEFSGVTPFVEIISGPVLTQNADEPQKESSEIEAAGISRDGISGPGSTDSLAARPDCTPIELGEFSAQINSGPGNFRSTLVESNSISSGTSDGSSSDNSEQAKASLGTYTADERVVIRDVVCIKSPVVTSYADTRAVDQDYRESDYVVPEFELRCASGGGSPANSRVTRIQGESETVHRTGSSGEGEMGAFGSDHDSNR